MGRSIESFTGKNAIICCSTTTSVYLNKHYSSEHYYSISLNADNPHIDYKLDITTEELPSQLKARFDITYLENFEFYSYNSSTQREQNMSFWQTNDAKGFANARAMTKDDGFIIIKGCPRQNKLRKILQHLKYVEISIDGKKEQGVIIPNDQSISIETFNQTIADNPEMIGLLRKLNNHYFPSKPKFDFSKDSYVKFPSFGDRAPSTGEQEPTKAELESISKHKKMVHVAPLYRALKSFSQLILTEYDEALKTKIAPFALKLVTETDHFFKYPTSIICTDVPVLKTLLSNLIDNFNTKNADIPGEYKRGLSDILRALEKVSVQSEEYLEPERESFCFMQ